MSEKELEIKEVKEAIETLRKYCLGCDNCNECDEAIKKWCSEMASDSPFTWEV